MRLLRTFVLLALLGATITGTPRFAPAPLRESSPAATASSQDLRPEILALLSSGLIPGSPTPLETTLVQHFYAADAAPVWIDDAGGPSAAGRQALDLLAGADSHGLAPARYALTASPDNVVSFEVELTLAMLRFMDDISTGRVDPASLGFQLPAGLDAAALPGLLRTHASAGRTSAAVSAAMPVVGNYEGVRHALATYRVLASEPETPALPTGAPSIHVGDPLPWAPALRARLERLGDLPPTTGPDAGYSPALEAGVKSFQRRHGLTDDGVLGKATITALNVPLSVRVRQLELALERLRWLPRDLDGPVILVNIPMFRLWAWDDVRAAVPALSMKVVVGTVGRNATPVLASAMDRLIFRPYWNVPRSILMGEILPKAKADPHYLTTHHYEIVRGETDRSPVVPITPESLRELELGSVRLRQLPGTFNALGLVKFDFPNRQNVFLHDTPAQSAFARDLRALSHGCVRVADPMSLAAWALGSATDDVQQTATGSTTEQRKLPRPVHILLTYATAAVDADGTVRFASDVYGHDVRLDHALR